MPSCSTQTPRAGRQEAVSELVTSAQRAAEEHRTLGALYHEHHRGLGPPRQRIGRRTYYERSELEAWRQARQEHEHLEHEHLEHRERPHIAFAAQYPDAFLF